MRVVVPVRTGDCEYRELAWHLVRDHWRSHDIEPIEVDDDGEVFSRGGSINRAIEGLPDDEIVVAVDADIVVDIAAVEDAVRLAAEPGLVQPYDRIQYLDSDWRRVEWDFTSSPATPLFGGANVFSVETWRRAGGFLPAFRGWGCEDVAFAHQCEIAIRPWRRVHSTLTHLWHPKTGRYVEIDNGPLMARVLACGTPDELKEVARDLQVA